MKQVAILGATGSIGQSTLDIIARHPDRFGLFAVSANRSHESMLSICERHRPRFAVLRDPQAARQLGEAVAHLPTEVLCGDEDLCTVAAAAEVDIVVAAIVGAAGLQSTLSAVGAGKRILLANKESLVMAGALFMEAVRRNQAELLPVDSEHNAIFQCLPDSVIGQGIDGKGVEKIILTGSGGPLRDLDLEAFEQVTPRQACAHPNWDMGPKISVDSATMMNKGLEMIEACWLFAVEAERVEILLHRQSIVHSMVSYNDGSVIAQMGNPDMRTPIANALAWPERIESGVEPLNLLQVSQLDFTLADAARYPCLALARAAWQQGGTAMALLNAANEVAVDYFLNGQIKFNQIAELIDKVMEQAKITTATDLESILQADELARAQLRALVGGH